MYCHLEHKICLSETSEHTPLYSWSLQEFDKNKKKIGPDQIPWFWSLYFTANELDRSYSLKLNKSSEEKKEEEYIWAKMHSGICRDGEWKDAVSYSMFGTERETKDFKLRISKIDENEDKKDIPKCHIWGCPSYTSEVDFIHETEDDAVIIFLYLSGKQFNKIDNLIKNGRIDILEIQLSGVSGFYSEWSPSIKTNNIKILTNDLNFQKFTRKNKCKIDPPRLGNVSEFNITATQRHKMNLRHDIRIIDIDELFADPEKEEFDEKKEENLAAKDSLILSQLAGNEKALKNLGRPIWFIFIILCFLLFGL